MADTKPARELPKFILRFSEELQGKIKAEAEKNRRSMTAEIVRLIEQGFERREHEEWLEARYREIQEKDPDEVYEHHKREMEEYEREQEPPAGMLRHDITELRGRISRLEEHLTSLGRRRTRAALRAQPQEQEKKKEGDDQRAIRFLALELIERGKRAGLIGVEEDFTNADFDEVTAKAFWVTDQLKKIDAPGERKAKK